jgi:dihydrofolate reductase
VRIGMVWAQASGGAIGRDGDMPWSLPEDLAHFKATTLGAPVIMGRKTWESLPESFRPLPGRENVVVTRDAGYDAAGARVAGSLDAAINALEDRGAPIAWIVGGGQLYRAAMPIADELIVTRIELEVEGADTFAPEIGEEWTLVDPGIAQVSRAGLGYRFERWGRRRPIP